MIRPCCFIGVGEGVRLPREQGALPIEGLCCRILECDLERLISLLSDDLRLVLEYGRLSSWECSSSEDDVAGVDQRSTRKLLFRVHLTCLFEPLTAESELSA